MLISETTEFKNSESSVSIVTGYRLDDGMILGV
jgi:hypothetical protein